MRALAATVLAAGLAITGTTPALASQHDQYYVGPFTTDRQCSDYRAGMNNPPHYVAYPCYYSTSDPGGQNRGSGLYFFFTIDTP
ncbi:hypothetical protein [Actinokineospora enzanensis]|uniref:hypothetical protein n=1 Tax=Actinokineospora enzanensis TaxID=155975 RepID=UPI00035ED775|nr:hypothetical protein [Actinokineospora enzanensis]